MRPTTLRRSFELLFKSSIATLAAADFDPGAQTYIFDIGGNKYRLLVTIDLEEQTFTIESVMTHEQYNWR